MPSSGASSSTGSARAPAGCGLGWRTRALAWLARRFGPQFVLPTINTLEQRDSGQYDAQPEAVAGGLPAAERSHARVVEALGSVVPGRAAGSALARLEGRHRALAATRCAPRCSAPMTGSSRISAW